jgi:hypothetical protein
MVNSVGLQPAQIVFMVVLGLVMALLVLGSTIAPGGFFSFAGSGSKKTACENYHFEEDWLVKGVGKTKLQAVYACIEGLIERTEKQNEKCRKLCRSIDAFACSPDPSYIRGLCSPPECFVASRAMGPWTEDEEREMTTCISEADLRSTCECDWALVAWPNGPGELA